MKDSTQDFIQATLVILLVGGFFFLIFGGLGYLIYQTETQDARMYTVCLDTCERVFQEDSVIECIQTCNGLGDEKPKGLNTSVGNK